MSDLFNNVIVDGGESFVEIPTDIIGGSGTDGDNPKPAGGGEPAKPDDTKGKGEGPVVEIPDEIIAGGDAAQGSAEGGAGKSNQSSSPFSTLANAFVTAGYLPSESIEEFNKLTKEDGMEKFIELYEEHRLDSDIKILTEEQKQYLEYLKDGVPQQEIEVYQSRLNQLNQFTDDVINEDSDAGKRARATMLLSDLMTKGMSQEEATDIVAVMLEKDDAAKKAIKARDMLKKNFEDKFNELRESTKKEQISEVEKQKDNLAKIKKQIFDNRELFDGKVKLTQKMAEKVYNATVTIAGETKNGQPVNAIMKAINDNPIEVLPKLGYLWVMTNGLKDLNGFNNKAMTDATRALEEIAGRPVTNSAYTPGSQAAMQVAKQTGDDLAASIRALGL